MEINRSLSACLRCRRQKLKCGGPGKIPCQRCRTSNSECIFVPPKAIQPRSSASDSDTKMALLEERLNLLEGQLRAEIQELRTTLEQAPSHRDSEQISSPDQRINLPVDYDKTYDIVSHSTTTECEWDELYAFFRSNCTTVVAVIDDQLYSPASVIRQHPLMSTVVCAIASRAIRPEKYQRYIAETDKLIMNTFHGPVPDLLSVYAMIIFTAWTSRTRLLGYIASVSTEMKLHETAIRLGDEDAEHTQVLVSRARCWFTLCCLDLQINISRPFVVNRMRDYLPFAKNLLTSPFRQPVDDRICAYITGFTITGNVKGHLQSTQLQTKPLPQGAADLLISSDEKVDHWFHGINNNVHPLYQTFREKQDRNRLMVPFAFMKLYINGLVMHGVDSEDDLTSDPARIPYIRKALDSAGLIIQTQFESNVFRQAFRYTMDYSGTATYYAISFILKAIPVAHRHIDCHALFTRLRQAAQMFEQGGATDVASELRQDAERIAVLTQIDLSPGAIENHAAEMPVAALFDIPNFFDEMAWDDEFPALSSFPYD